MPRILPDNPVVMTRRRIVEIDPDRRRGDQDVHRDARRLGSRDPRTPITVSVLASAAAIIDLVAGVVHVVVLHHIDRGRWGVRPRMMRFLHVGDASGERAQQRRADDEADH
jgi:hypothetical protein